MSPTVIGDRYTIMKTVPGSDISNTGTGGGTNSLRSASLYAALAEAPVPPIREAQRERQSYSMATEHPKLSCHCGLCVIAKGCMGFRESSLFHSKLHDSLPDLLVQMTEILETPELICTNWTVSGSRFLPGANTSYFHRFLAQELPKQNQEK